MIETPDTSNVNGDSVGLLEVTAVVAVEVRVSTEVAVAAEAGGGIN